MGLDFVTPFKNLLNSFRKKEPSKETRPGLFSLSHLSLSQRSLNSRPKEKTDREAKMILRSICNNSAFSPLSPDEKRKLVENFARVELDKDDILFRQGDYGHYFYVITKGKCELYIRKRNKKSFHRATLQEGSHFGELALIYNGYRRGTVVASEPSVLYALDRNSFIKATSYNSELIAVFDKFALIIDEVENSKEPLETQRYMDVNGFIKAMTQNRENLPEIDYDAEDQRLRSLFRLIDRHGSGMIDFSEFALFLRILSSPDPDFDLAFYYFDKDSDDAITKSEFIDILKSNISEEAENAFLNLDCETMKRFFGSEGNERSLNFYEFTEFFIQFQIEYARQLFLSQDEEGKGYISADSFVNITKLLGDPRAFAYSDYLLSSVSSKKKVTFAEFVGFQKFLQHLPAIKHMLWSTFKKFPNSNIDMNNFRALMRSNAVTTFSPIEAAICFQLFGTNNGTIITAASFREKIINFHMGEEVFCKPNGNLEVHEDLVYDHRVDTRPELATANNKSPYNSYTNPPRVLVLRDFVSNPNALFSKLGMAFVSSSLGALTLFPLDSIKTRMQFNRKAPIIEGLYIYKNSYECLKRTIQQQGVKGLYRGLLPFIIGVVPEKTIKIWCNHHLRIMFENNNKGGINFPLEVLAGAAAGMAQTVITNPMELLKIRMQLFYEYQPKGKGQNHVRAAPAASFFTLFKQLNFSGLYTGLIPCIIRDASFSALMFPLYASLKARMANPEKGLSVEGLIMAGVGAVIPAAFITTPMDVIKTRMQAVPITTDDWKLNKQLKYRTMAECVSTIRSLEGLQAFWKGAVQRMCYWSPQFAVTLFAYEMMLRHFTLDFPLTHIPVTSQDLALLRARNVREQVNKMDRELKILR